MSAATEPASPPELVIVGRIGGAHGVAGLVRVASETRPKDNILRYRPWWVGDGGAFRPVRVRSVQAHGERFVAAIDGIDDRDAAQALAGAQVAVPRRSLPELEAGHEYYWRDLIGLSAVNTDGTPLGQVVSLMDAGAHAVLVIEGTSPRQVLIPFVAAHVREVDLPGGIVHVDWLEPA